MYCMDNRDKDVCERQGGSHQLEGRPSDDGN